MERLLTIGDVAEIVGVSERTVRNAIKDGRLSALRFGRNVRIEPEAIRRWGSPSQPSGLRAVQGGRW